MGRRVHEDELHVYFCTTIADMSAPTVDEITTDGTDLTPQIMADGVSYNPTKNTASAELLSGKVRQAPGTRGYAPQLTALRDSDTDDFWDEFDYQTEGYLVVSPFGVPEADSTVYVFKGSAQEPHPSDSGANTYQQSIVDFPADDWDLNATVASGV